MFWIVRLDSPGRFFLMLRRSIFTEALPCCAASLADVVSKAGDGILDEICSIWNLARCCLEKCDHRCGSGRAYKESQFPREDQAGCYRRCGDHGDSLPAMAEGISLLFEGHQTSCLNCAAGFAWFFRLKCGRYLRTKWIYSLLADWWSFQDHVRLKSCKCLYEYFYDATREIHEWQLKTYWVERPRAIKIIFFRLITF